MTELEKVKSVVGEVYVDTYELEKEVKKKLGAYEVYCEGKKVFILFDKHGEEYELGLRIEDKYYHIEEIES